jgi:hypothetical protein
MFWSRPRIEDFMRKREYLRGKLTKIESQMLAHSREAEEVAKQIAFCNGEIARLQSENKEVKT